VHVTAIRGYFKWLQKSKHAVRFSEPVEESDFSNSADWQFYQRVVPAAHRMDISKLRDNVNRGVYGYDGNGTRFYDKDFIATLNIWKLIAATKLSTVRCR
jgi:hypothetical protein